MYQRIAVFAFSGQGMGTGERIKEALEELGGDVVMRAPARLASRGWKGFSTLAKELEEGFLQILGIPSFLKVPVSKLSGGMKKRVSLAIALINNPDILLLDEPFASLDLPAKEDILKIMKNFLCENKSIIVASHDNNVFDFCNKVYLLKDGKLMDAHALINKGISYVDILRSGV